MSRDANHSGGPVAQRRAKRHGSTSCTGSKDREDRHSACSTVPDAMAQDGTDHGTDATDTRQQKHSLWPRNLSPRSHDLTMNDGEEHTAVGESTVTLDQDNTLRGRRESPTWVDSRHPGSRTADVTTDVSRQLTANVSSLIEEGHVTSPALGRRSFEDRHDDDSHPPSTTTSRSAIPATAPPACSRAGRGAVRVPPESHFQPVVTAPKKPRPMLPMLVVGACLVAVLTVVIIVVVLMSGSPIPPPSVCWTHECQEYGKLLRSSIDDSVPPCHNFTRFVCGGWQREHRLSVREELYERAIERMTRLVRTIEVPKTDQNSVQLAAAIYRSCDYVLQGERDELAAVKKYLLDAGIAWPRRSRNGDVVHTLLFSSLRLGWHVILRVEPRWSEKGATTFLVDPGGAFHLVRRARDANDFEQYFKRLTETFGGAGGNNDIVSLEDVVEAEGSFRDTLSAAYYDRTEYQVFPERTFLGLGESRWIDVLKKLNFSVGKRFQVLTTARRFVYGFFNLWDNYGEEEAYGYTSWCTVQVAALYANRQLVLNYHGGSVRRAQAYYGAFCVTAAFTFSRYALFGGYNIEVLRGKTRSVAEDVTRSVGDSFLRRLSRWQHFKSNVEVVTNWSSLSRAFRGFEAAHDATRGPTGLDMTDSFVENWRLSTLVPSSLDDWVLVDVIDSLEMFALYVVGHRRDFQLLPAALSFPFFDLGLTAPVNYGGLGAHVAWALGLLLLTAYGADQSLKATVEQLKNCIAGKSKTTDADAVTSIAVTAGALLEALDSNSDTASRLPIPQLESFSATQLFFVSLCFAHCEGSDSAVQWADICDQALRHVRSFAHAFGCAPASSMNPEQLCDVP
ncbi:hypothetical protein HPB52_007660 [Rhipicephalus sanguineus]|uniref:Peptidase M13 N-terminal domain-containing protein n=1 Tax=Rhipicephalus sanguineus TaxID=34632 RepID=A0A9D4PV02_RHISA|nr:hypothetical protein HPB52_007660 [Rhipicephalus sanguineus]